MYSVYESNQCVWFSQGVQPERVCGSCDSLQKYKLLSEMPRPCCEYMSTQLRAQLMFVFLLFGLLWVAFRCFITKIVPHSVSVTYGCSYIGEIKYSSFCFGTPLKDPSLKTTDLDTLKV